MIMRVKDLKDNYNVLERFGFYHLYDPEPGSGSRMVHKYLCSVKKVGPTKFRLRGGRKVTSDFAEFQKMVAKKLDSYKYDSEYYDPNYRRGLFEYFVIYDYMREMGFKCEDSEYFYLDRKRIYKYQTTNIKMSIYGLDPMGRGFFSNDDKLKKEVTVVLHTGDYSWTEVKAKRNVEEIKSAVDSMLKPLLLSEGVENIVTSDKMDDPTDIEIFFNKFDFSSLESKPESARAAIKEKLLALAEEL
jgi:hypothetical protein